MIILSLFCYFSYSKIGKIHFKPKYRFFFLSSFGFDVNGKFKFYINSSAKTKLIISLVSYQEMPYISSRLMQDTCSKQKPKHIAKLNKTFRVEKDIFQWSGKIVNKSVYYPLFVICDIPQFALDIQYNYSNINYFIDYRAELNSQVYFAFSLINMVLAIMWICNTFYYNAFVIPLHQLLAFLPMLKSITDALIALEWEQKRYSEDVSKVQTYLSIAMSTIFYSLIITAICLAVSGWCVFRMAINIKDIASFFGSSACVVSGLMITRISPNTESMAPLLLICFGIFWFMKVCVSYVIFIFLITESDFKNTAIKTRIKTVHNFFEITSAFSFLMLFILSGSVTLDLWPVISIFVMESGIVILEIIQMYFFFLRDKYEGKQECIDSGTLYLIVDPQQSYTALSFHETDEFV